MFGFDVGASELGGFVTAKEDDAAGFFRISFKHNCYLEELGQSSDCTSVDV
jgi:hypothetical protein